MLDINHYFTNEELEEIIGRWEKEFPGLLKIEEIGQSYQGRPIWCLTIGNQSTGPDLEKPAFYLDGNIHATEVAGTTTALRVVERLLRGYDDDPRLRWLLDQTVYYVIPRVNPDGAAAAMAEHPHYVRSSMRPYPYDELDEGIHASDITGDGRILQMRLKDPSGEWKVCPDDPRLMILREPGDLEGEYYRLLPEGMVHDYDGDIIKRGSPKEGLDMNRNFPFEYQAQGAQHGAGDYPAQEPEVRALVEFIVAHPNINTGISLHTYARAILRPYATHPDSDMPVPDLKVYKTMGKIGTALTGYRTVSVYHDFRYEPNEVVTGVFNDWLYDARGAYTFTIEQWDLPTAAGIKDRKFIEWSSEHDPQEDLQILKYIDEHQPQGCLPWGAYQHPQLGEVEIGGWDLMYTWRNPPPSLMGAEAERNTDFIVALGFLMPQLRMVKSEVKALGEDTWALKLVFENSGWLPTYTSQAAKKRKLLRPIRVELELPEGVRLAQGKIRVEVEHLEGRSNKGMISSAYGGSSMDNRAKAEWTLCAPAGSCVRYHILSERAGCLHGEITLG